MKTLALMLLFAMPVLAAPSISVVSVNNVKKVKDNVYTAEKNTVPTPGELSAGDQIQQYVTLETFKCTHVPSAGASAMILRAPGRLDGTKVLFSDGGVCVVLIEKSSSRK